MLLFNNETGGRGYHLIPLSEDRLYVYCKNCKRIMRIKDPASYFIRIGSDGGTLGGDDHWCEECLSGEETATLLKDIGLHEKKVTAITASCSDQQLSV